MNAINYRNKQYRVVSRSKFIISMMILTVLAILAVTGISMLIFNFVPGLQNKDINIFPKLYTEKDLTIIIAKDEKEIKELNDTIKEDNGKYSVLEAEYKNIATSSIDEQKYNILKEYEYVLNNPSSDFTPQDITNTIDYCKTLSDDPKYPHLWFALVQLESHYYSQAASRGSSAHGWGQIIKPTAKSIYEDMLKLGNNYNHNMAFDKETNMKMSIFYLIRATDHAGIKQGLINYNGGELGERYADIVANNLKENSGLTFADIDPHFSKNYKPAQ